MAEHIPVASPRIIRAINVAASAHRNDVRKGTDIPYVSHVFGVMHFVSQVTDDEDVLIGALFHDIFEDVPEEYSAKQMVAEFGERVVGLVRGVTKDDSIGSWQGRADAYLAQLREAEEGSVLIAAADKLHNLLSIHADLDTIGDDLWGRFNSPVERQVWWYRSVCDVVQERLPGNQLGAELRRQVERLEARTS
ncbi:bifunctional (p)ppGpp synthetase/guanosine-3',5'-bis(diphosphate) 3'-pyrophosphohydrolase [Corynebacterium coyleae]|uniref:HD domain-containing protein n=1 Tax=Corynebacterium coyleae TaxID=53374 RepID=UPI000C77A88E|nr:HD domain-containing protein [Corynebacterium coyleae]PLA37462.1 bifunctional (p)ppGpp synthetase/guanosine-3',5'-bis(diphosphate) 3'-pyrophosphohydrolase [Corynebacterium coyleae]